MQLPLTLQLKPSRILRLFLLSGHALSGVAVLFLPLAWVWQGLALLVLGFLLLRMWQCHDNAVQALILRADGKLGCVLQNGADSVSEVAAQTVILPWLVVVHLCEKRAPLVLFPDALLHPSAHRELRVWLKWKALANAAV